MEHYPNEANISWCSHQEQIFEQSLLALNWKFFFNNLIQTGEKCSTIVILIRWFQMVMTQIQLNCSLGQGLLWTSTIEKPECWWGELLCWEVLAAHENLLEALQAAASSTAELCVFNRCSASAAAEAEQRPHLIAKCKTARVLCNFTSASVSGALWLQSAVLSFAFPIREGWATPPFLKRPFYHPIERARGSQKSRSTPSSTRFACRSIS